MPIYEYFCEDCEDSFEIRVSLSEKEKGLKVNPVRERSYLTECADGGIRPPSVLNGDNHQLKSEVFSNGVNCPKCGNNKTVQILGNFSTFTKDGGSGSGSGCCGPDAPTGCCG